MHLNYDTQLKSKRAIIEQSLYHIGGKTIGDLLTPLLLSTVPSSNQLAYRNKVQLPVRNPKDSNRLLAGYFETNSHNLVNIKHCPIQPHLLDDILAEIKLLAEKYNFVAYDEKTGRGFLRHIQMRISQTQNHVLVTLVLNCNEKNMPTFMAKFAPELMEKFSQIKGVCANFNEAKGNRILGDNTICLSGQSFIEESLATTKVDFPQILKDGLKFRLSPESFFQVNTDQALTLLELVAEEVKNYISQCQSSSQSNNITLLDAYAGVGTIALWLAPFVSNVVAIESNPHAVKDGEINQSLNKISNVQFQLAKVENYLPQLLKNGTSVEILVLDPPRQGLDPAVIDAIIKMQPKLIVYISCNPVTLARDLKLILSEKSVDLSVNADPQTEKKNDCLKLDSGYKVEKILPIDLFPQTYHIESIAVLKKQ